MICKLIKLGLLSAVGLTVAGGLVFGRELCSYVSSSARSVRTAVKDAVPVDFELRRARDLVDDIIPEMHACVRMIAQQEVEIAQLNKDIEQSRKQLDEERTRVAKLREALASPQSSFTFNGFSWSREQVKEDLAHRFDNLKEAEVVLSGKQRLLENRQRSLAAAMQTLDRTRSQKSLLESQIAALEGQNQLVKAASVGSELNIDNSKLAQSEKLIAEIKKQLDVAERVLAHESRFVQPIPVDAISEKDLVNEIDAHLAGAKVPVADQTVTAQR
jgi:chromosome segregation ATPase